MPDPPPRPQGGGSPARDERQGAGSNNNAGAKLSYSDRLKTNVRYDQRFKRNILEITLEKSDPSIDIAVDEEDVARVFKTLGIEIMSQLQGYQIKYMGSFSIISVWMAPGTSLDRFCKDVSIKVADGVSTGLIKPAGKQDVMVSMVGLDFNTPDSFVVEYMNKFGVVMSNAAVYSKFESGPFKGKYNGERKYQVDFSKAAQQMGTFHLIDGNKVKVFYRGNRKTCGRCHRVASECPGAAIARNCASGGGQRVLLSEHMKNLWKLIGFTPTSFNLDETDKSIDDVEQSTKDAAILAKPAFNPAAKTEAPSERDIELSDGITIQNFPKTLKFKPFW